MPAINFKKEFVPRILNGTKIHTIRVERVHPIKEGDTLYLNTGMRTKNFWRILTFKCLRVRSIQIQTTFDMIWIEGILLSRENARKLIQADGFDTKDEFFRFFDAYDEDTRFNKLRLIQWAETDY